MQRKHIHYGLWFLVALVAALIAAPNSMFIKVALDQVGPAWFNILRLGLVSLVMLPAIILARKKFTPENIRYSLIAGSSFGLAVVCYVKAIEMTQASYVSVIALSVPIIFMVYSAYFTKERISKRAVFGISVAALGAFLIVAIPFISTQGITSSFAPIATILVLINCAAYPLSTIFTRKANEAGLPLGATLGVSFVITVLIAALIAALTSEPLPSMESILRLDVMFALIFSGVIALLLTRAMSVAAFERIGSAAIGGLSYFESFLAIILPLLILGEHMTLEMIIGGTMILLGVIVVETHFQPKAHRYHHHAFRHRL